MISLAFGGHFSSFPNLNGDDGAIEDMKFRAYLAAHGLEGKIGKEDLKALADEGIPSSIVYNSEARLSALSELNNTCDVPCQGCVDVYSSRTLSSPSLPNTNSLVFYQESKMLKSVPCQS